MSRQRFIQRTIPLAAAALVGAAPAVFAQWGGQQRVQGQELFEWAGRVDREVQVIMRGNQLSTRNVGENESGRARSRVVMGIPRRGDGEVVAQLVNGRGRVDVIQQPNAQNGFTTILRVIDPSAGDDVYRIAAYWLNNSNGDYVGNPGRGRARGRDRDRDRDDDWVRGNRDDVYDNRSRNGQGMLQWSGNVDGELEIRIQNGRVDYRNLSGGQPTSIRVNRGNASVQRDGQVSIAQAQGRGSVTIIQQPSSWNSYTTVVRIRDPQGGYGYYNFDLMWR